MTKWLIFGGIAAFAGFAWFLLPSPHGIQEHEARDAVQGEARGVVLAVDAAAASLTIRHGPIGALGMGPMTMEFQVRDAAVLQRLKQGDEIAFSVEVAGGTLVVTGLEVFR